MRMRHPCHLLKKILPVHGFAMLLLVITCQAAPGQAGRFLQLGGGFQLAAERDSGFSPLAFSGAGAFAAVSWLREKEAKTDMIEGSYTSVSLNNRFGSAMGIRSAGLMVWHFYHAGGDPGGGMQWGWSNHNAFSVRDNEAANNFNHRFDYFTSFGPAARFRHSFSMLNRTFTVQALMHIQLVGFVIQSSYVSQSPAGYEVETIGGLDVFRRSVEWFLPGQAWDVGVWPSLVYATGRGNRFSLNYRYGFTRLDGAHSVTKSRGFWFIGIHAGI